MLQLSNFPKCFRQALRIHPSSTHSVAGLPRRNVTRMSEAVNITPDEVESMIAAPLTHPPRAAGCPPI